MELFEQIRREYRFGVGTIRGVAKQFGVHRRIVRQKNLRTKYGLTSLKAGGSCLALTAINEALEAAAQIADQSHAPEIANQIRALKWEAKMPSYASEIQAARDVA